LQGRLANGLPAILSEVFPGLTADAQRAVQFVRSTPGIDVALVGMKSLEHVEDILAAMKQPPASRDALMKLFSSGKQ
jgi:aryl-alcohol dehydrogenase-like predicted oxidoreductase